MKKSAAQLFGAIVLLLALVPAGQAAEKLYHLLKEIPVGGEGGWDYLSVDSPARRLYVAHATKVVVLDLDKEVVVGEITNTPGVHGFAIADDLRRGFSSNGREAKASIVDLKTLKTLSKVDTGQNPDAILYQRGQEEIYAFNGGDHSATVFEAMTGKVLATVKLSGKPEFAVTDIRLNRVYCNIEDKNEVAVIDSRNHQVIHSWPIAPGQEASGLAVDLFHHRLFLGCGNKLMVMMNSTNGQVLATVPIGEGVDATAFDPGTQMAFSSSGEGTVTIAREETPQKLAVVQTLKTKPGARTMTFDPKTHKIYLGAFNFEEKDSAGQKQKPIPDSFHILVYGLE